MELFEFVRIHVKSHCVGYKNDWTDSDIINAFCILPAPGRSLTDANALISALFAPAPQKPELTDDEKAQINAKSIAGMAVKKES